MAVQLYEDYIYRYGLVAALVLSLVMSTSVIGFDFQPGRDRAILILSLGCLLIALGYTSAVLLGRQRFRVKSYSKC